MSNSVRIENPGQGRWSAALPEVPAQCKGFFDAIRVFSSSPEQGELPDMVNALNLLTDQLLKDNPNDNHLKNMKRLLEASKGCSTKNFPYDEWIKYFDNSQYKQAPKITAFFREIKEQDAPRNFTTFFGKQFMANVSTLGGLLKSKSADAAGSLSHSTKVKIAAGILVAWVVGLASVTGVALKVAAVVSVAAAAMTCFQWLKGMSNRSETNAQKHEKIKTLTSDLQQELADYINTSGIDANYTSEPQAKFG